MIKSKVVLDTNIYLSAIIFGGMPRKVLELGFEEKIIVFISPAILLEIALKFKEKFSWEEAKIIPTIQIISQLAKIIKPRKKIRFVKKDSSDNKIIELAAETKADFIITGDRHLLELKRFFRIKIMNPADFYLQFLKSSRSSDPNSL